MHIPKSERYKLKWTGRVNSPPVGACAVIVEGRREGGRGLPVPACHAQEEEEFIENRTHTGGGGGRLSRNAGFNQSAD